MALKKLITQEKPSSQESPKGIHIQRTINPSDWYAVHIAEDELDLQKRVLDPSSSHYINKVLVYDGEGDLVGHINGGEDKKFLSYRAFIDEKSSLSFPPASLFAIKKELLLNSKRLDNGMYSVQAPFLELGYLGPLSGSEAFRPYIDVLL